MKIAVFTVRARLACFIPWFMVMKFCVGGAGCRDTACLNLGMQDMVKTELTKRGLTKLQVGVDGSSFQKAPFHISNVNRAA